MQILHRSLNQRHVSTRSTWVVYQYYQKHVLTSFCYKMVTTDNSHSGDLVSFTAVNESDDVAQMFMEELEKDVKTMV